MTTEDHSLLSKVLAWIVVGVTVVFALRVLAMLFGAATFLLFKLGPLLIVGWLVWILWRYLTRAPDAE